MTKMTLPSDAAEQIVERFEAALSYISRVVAEGLGRK
jgi:hypothetical protein